MMQAWKGVPVGCRQIHDVYTQVLVMVVLSMVLLAHAVVCLLQVCWWVVDLQVRGVCIMQG